MADDASEELSSDRVLCPPTGPSCHAASGKVLSRADGLGGPIHLVDHGAVLAPLHRHRCRTVDKYATRDFQLRSTELFWRYCCFGCAGTAFGVLPGVEPEAGAVFFFFFFFFLFGGVCSAAAGA